MAMATALLSPLVTQRRPGYAVSAAAPWLVTLLAVAAFSCSSPVAAASPELVELTLLANAREKGAGMSLLGCIVIYCIKTQGGAWCNTTEDCSDRRLTDLGSSKFMKAIGFEGILSNNRSQNPYFYNWNKVDFRYCDGGSFAGDADGKDRNGTKLFFRGLRIWEAVVDELMGKGLATAKQALLSGCSAGGLAALLHCDNFRARFPQEVPVKCLSDAAFFLDKGFIRTMVHARSQENNLIRDGSRVAKLTFETVVPPKLRLHGFRKKLLDDLKVAQYKRDWGLFIDSCFNHCQTPFRISWHSRISLRLGNKTIAEAFGDWYFGRGHGVKEIDCEYPCINPTCRSQLDL
ncbi:unnamed protein product [Urochloa decumbens]|uniref:Pectin acetylesterase n=1 Tax=Urochloa decumbens TaxID=240449 RepID=A0ABC8Z545_9POAL